MISGMCKVARHYQIVVPKHVRNIIGLKIGDLVNFQLKKDGKIILTPVEVKKKDQQYFWTTKWQKAIKKSEQELKKGNFKTYNSAEELEKDIEK
ncbi:MAG: AbrB/MazE/SpoVT family DNA-binding domain-containing protein [Elusimicrobiota bacterium]